MAVLQKSSAWRLGLLLPALLAAQLAAAQSAAGMRGRVLDPSLAPIAGAKVQTGGEPGIPAVSVKTDGAGDFSLTLNPGSYTLTIEAAGFQTAHAAVSVPGKDHPDKDHPEMAQLRRDFTLAVAPSRYAVTVLDTGDYRVPAVSSASKTLTPLIDIPQSITVIPQEQIRDQQLLSIADVVNYVPGVSSHQGENNRDQVIIRGNNTSADFFVDGVRDDVQYYRDLYNLDRIEVLKGSNAMEFGRGGGGGVINQVTKEAGFMPLRQFLLSGGSFSDRRFIADLDQPLNNHIAVRLNGMYEGSDSFRKYVNMNREGINPTITIAPDSKTKITLGYEYLHDQRVADRGVTSFLGRPANVDPSTYYGNPYSSDVHADVNIGTATFERQIGRFKVRNHTLVGAYDRGYQNYVPGAATADGTQVSLSAYNNATRRKNIFNQTDVTYEASTGRIRHTLLAGIEIGRQLTDNFRNTGYFNNTATSILVPFYEPTITSHSTFRQSATDADNHLKTNLGAAYVQDQMELSRHWQVIAGVRFDHFDLEYHDNRAGTDLRRIDNLVSPRTGLVYKPAAKLSVYGSYSVSYLPSSGDQFSSLTTITQQVKPEHFNNYEGGVKWDIRPSLSFTAALYRLDRTNTRSTDPNDPTRIIQTGSQRTNGFEAGLAGSITRLWKISGGYSYQDAFVTSATTSAKAGAQVGEVPHHTLSLWNNYQFLPKLGGGLGILHRTDMFVAVDNAVVLPGYTRADAAVYVPLGEHMRLQANIENLFGAKYYINADSNTNISPGSPRGVRFALTTRF
ncbi:MAG TPA: TonB-dependent siderophore receptor [Bryobacteraceae bacterium]|jgi:catecholate siderophore receptor